MLFILILNIFPLCLTVVVAFPWHEKESKYDERCTIDERAYTGIRVMHERILQIPSRVETGKQTVIIECESGSELYNLTVPAGDSIFNHDLDVHQGAKKIRIVRRPTYTNNDKLKYIPGTVMGGVYELDNDGACQKDNVDKNAMWRPISPLVADRWRSISHETQARNRTAQLRITTSLIRSPDVLEKSYAQSLNWTKYIPWEEES